MANLLRATLWLVIPFTLTLIFSSAFVTRRGEHGAPVSESREISQSAALQLVGRTINEAALIEAESRTFIEDLGLSLPDTAVAVLLGAVGCSTDQMHVLQHWVKTSAESGVSGHPVLAI